MDQDRKMVEKNRKAVAKRVQAVRVAKIYGKIFVRALNKD